MPAAAPSSTPRAAGRQRRNVRSDHGQDAVLQPVEHLQLGRVVFGTGGFAREEIRLLLPVLTVPDCCSFQPSFFPEKLSEKRKPEPIAR